MSSRTVNLEFGRVSMIVPSISTASFLGNGSLFFPPTVTWIGHKPDSAVNNFDGLRAAVGGHVTSRRRCLDCPHTRRGLRATLDASLKPYGFARRPQLPTERLFKLVERLTFARFDEHQSFAIANDRCASANSRLVRPYSRNASSAPVSSQKGRFGCALSGYGSARHSVPATAAGAAAAAAAALLEAVGAIHGLIAARLERNLSLFPAARACRAEHLALPAAA